jgi:hypothetical protein
MAAESAEERMTGNVQKKKTGVGHYANFSALR